LSSKIFHQVHLHLGCCTKQASGGAGQGSHGVTQGVAGQGLQGVAYEALGAEHGQVAKDAWIPIANATKVNNPTNVFFIMKFSFLFLPTFKLYY